MNPRYERIGGILHATPEDETSALIDSPNFKVAKVVVDHVLSATSLEYISEIFIDGFVDGFNESIINYINSPIIDDLYKSVNEVLARPTYIDWYWCSAKSYKTVEFLLHQNLLNDDLIASILESSLSESTFVKFCSYDIFVKMYERTAAHFNRQPYKLHGLIERAICSGQFEILKYLLEKIPYSIVNYRACLNNSVCLKNSNIFHLIWNYIRLHKKNPMNMVLDFIANISNVDIMAFVLTEYEIIHHHRYLKIGDISPQILDNHNCDVVYYLYKNDYLDVGKLVADLIYRMKTFSCSVQLLKLAETIRSEKNLDFPINYDKLLYRQLMYYNDEDYIDNGDARQQEMTSYILTTHKDKLICKPEYYALTALMNSNVKQFKLFIKYGVDIHYDNDIYFRMYKMHEFEDFADVFT